MKLNEIFVSEGLIDQLKQKIGQVKGQVVASLKEILVQLKGRTSVRRLMTIETFKLVTINREIKCLVDTGARRCSLNASNIKVENKRVTFTTGGAAHDLPLVKMIDVKQAGGVTDRPLVKLDYTWNGKTYSGIETTLIDRSKQAYEVLIGRNLINELKLPVWADNHAERAEKSKSEG